MPQLKYWDGTQYVPLLGGIDQGTADTRYVKKAGDTMTGDLGIQKATPRLKLLGANALVLFNDINRMIFADTDELSITDSAASAYKPLRVGDPTEAWQAATRGWTHGLIRGLPSNPVVKTINSSTVQTINTGTVTPVPGTTSDLVLMCGVIMLQTPTAGCSWEAACVINGAYSGGQFRQTMPTGAGNYQNLQPVATKGVAHNGSPYQVRLDCWIATGTGTANVVADPRYNAIVGVAIAIA